jgi:hypothetical protein
VDLKPGDLFVVQSRSKLGMLIQEVEDHLFNDPGIYNHGAFITNVDGTILESKITYRYGNISHYIGRKILIVRHNDMTPECFEKGYVEMKKYLGSLYPVWRLPLFIMGVEKYFNHGSGVCSEMTGLFMQNCGFKNIVYGISPDDLAELWKKDVSAGKMQIIYEGIL